jgi:hypothetical protein
MIPSIAGSQRRRQRFAAVVLAWVIECTRQCSELMFSGARCAILGRQLFDAERYAQCSPLSALALRGTVGQVATAEKVIEEMN